MSLAVERSLTIGDARRALARRFAAAGLDTPELDARILLAHAVGLGALGLAASADRPLEKEEARVLEDFVRRRLAREPVARIVGCKEFWSLSFRISSATLVPRPETETVIEAALAALTRYGERERPLRIADLGTGSGILLLSLLSELPRAFGVGTDVSEAALEIAHDNAARLRLSHRASFVRGDYGVALAGGFDLVVSNPPYIKSGDLPALSPEVHYDPASALDGGEDGLSAYRRIAGDADRLLAPNGHLIVELGAGAANAVAQIFEAAGLAIEGEPRRDLSGIPRGLHVRRAPPQNHVHESGGKKPLGLSAGSH
jgi:release factor glutamine methyltransferase